MDADVKELYQELAREVRALSQKLESAFPKDDEGEPDYAAHRIFHKKQAIEEDEYRASKSKVVTQIISWLLIGIFTIIASSLFNTYIPTILRNIPKP